MKLVVVTQWVRVDEILFRYISQQGLIQMAKIYYQREGFGPKRTTGGFDISLEKLMTKIGTRTAKYVGSQPPPTFPAEREDLPQFRDPCYVLAQIAAEANHPEEGFYLLEGVDPREADGWN